jgi:hypothetical protein
LIALFTCSFICSVPNRSEDADVALCVYLSIFAGLSEDWDRGVIHCTPITAGLLRGIMGVKPEYVLAHELNTPFDVPGATVTFLGKLQGI